MRLTSEQVTQLITALNPFVQDNVAELRLYGSRARDDLKGGDIDLLLLVEHEEFASRLRSEKYYLLAEIKKNLGEQKIDLTIATQADVNHDPFLKMIFPESVLLKRW